eukprot:6118912-Prymnesium_polylepis.1
MPAATAADPGAPAPPPSGASTTVAASPPPHPDFAERLAAMSVRELKGLFPRHLLAPPAGATCKGELVDALVPVSYTHLTLPTICSV